MANNGAIAITNNGEYIRYVSRYIKPLNLGVF